MAAPRNGRWCWPPSRAGHPRSVHCGQRAGNGSRRHCRRSTRPSLDAAWRSIGHAGRSRWRADAAGAPGLRVLELRVRDRAAVLLLAFEQWGPPMRRLEWLCAPMRRERKALCRTIGEVRTRASSTSWPTGILFSANQLARVHALLRRLGAGDGCRAAADACALASRRRCRRRRCGESRVQAATQAASRPACARHHGRHLRDGLPPPVQLSAAAPQAVMQGGHAGRAHISGRAPGRRAGQQVGPARPGRR